MGQSSSKSSQPKAPLVQAALLKDCVEVTRLLEAGADVKECDAAGNHGLGAAACAGSLEVVDLILAKLSPSAVGDETGTPAAAPSSSSSSAPSTFSVVNLSNQMGCSPTWLAAGYGHLDVLDRLLSVGGDPNTCNGTGDSPLVAAASKAKVACCLRLLKCPTVDVHLRNGNGDSVLSLAAGKGLTEVVVAVLALLPPPPPPSSQQQQQQEGGAAASAAVAVAASSSSLVNSPNKHGISPLGGAVAFGGGGGSPFAAGAAPPNGSSSWDDGGQGGAAAGSGGAEGSGVQEEEAACVKALLLAGADCLEHRDMNGANCLMVAAHCSNAAATKAILQYLLHKPKQQPEQREEGQAEGGDSSLPTSEGKHAYLEAADENGATAVWLAAAAGSAEVVSLLLQAGADASGGSPGGVSALDAASKNGHTACVDLLTTTQSATLTPKT